MSHLLHLLFTSASSGIHAAPSCEITPLRTASIIRIKSLNGNKITSNSLYILWRCNFITLNVFFFCVCVFYATAIYSKPPSATSDADAICQPETAIMQMSGAERPVHRDTCPCIPCTRRTSSSVSPPPLLCRDKLSPRGDAAPRGVLLRSTTSPHLPSPPPHGSGGDHHFMVEVKHCPWDGGELYGSECSADRCHSPPPHRRVMHAGRGLRRQNGPSRQTLTRSRCLNGGLCLAGQLRICLGGQQPWL